MQSQDSKPKINGTYHKSASSGDTNLETKFGNVPKKERAASAKVERDEVREMIVVEVSEEPREPLPNPRKRMKKELIDSNRN
jgi:hypothetical protein